MVKCSETNEITWSGTTAIKIPMKSADMLINRRRKLKVEKIQGGTAFPSVWSVGLQPPGGKMEDRDKKQIRTQSVDKTRPNAVRWGQEADVYTYHRQSDTMDRSTQ